MTSQPTNAPRRFNPSGEAWLPILHEDRDGWAITVLYSNTQLAHELGKTTDWVVVYYDRDGEEGRATVVTEIRGPRRERRVVRGRERECAEHYRTAGLSVMPGPAHPPGAAGSRRTCDSASPPETHR